MKTLLTLILSLLFLYSCSSNIKDMPYDKNNLVSVMETYKKLLIDGDIEKSVEFMYPAVFQEKPKKEVIAQLKEIAKAKESFKILKIEAKPNLPVKNYDNGSYTTYLLHMEMKMNFASPPGADKEKLAEMNKVLKDPEKMKEFQEFMMKMLHMSMGKDADIQFEENSLIANIKQKVTGLAINENNTGWKFVDFPLTMKELENILPKEIFNNEKQILNMIFNKKFK